MVNIHFEIDSFGSIRKCMLWTWGVWDETRGKVTINWTETFNICIEMIEQLSAGLTEFSLQTENLHP